MRSAGISEGVSAAGRVQRLAAVFSSAHCTPEIVSTEEGTFNFWAQELTEHRKSP